MGNHKPQIEEGQTTQWLNEKGTKEQAIIYKTLHKKLKIEHQLKTGGELMCVLDEG
jgi:hypothetical protein